MAHGTANGGLTTTKTIMREGEGSAEAVTSRTAATNESHAQEAQHSPLPWRLDRLGVCTGNASGSGRGFRRVAICKSTCGYPNAVGDAEHRADAEFIVRASNSHDDLLESLKELSALAEGEWGWTREESLCTELCGLSQCQEYGCLPLKLDAARAAIVKAEA